MAILGNSPKSHVFPAPISREIGEINFPVIRGDRDMHESELMRYSEAIGIATESAARAELSPTLMVACLTRYIDVVVRCADDDGFRPNWSSKGDHEKQASVA